jgi:adenosylmethionine-8-amino-7-oxononanoate aminotransferase
MSGDHVVVAPPLIVSETEIKEILDLFEKALEETGRRLGILQP